MAFVIDTRGEPTLGSAISGGLETGFGVGMQQKLAEAIRANEQKRISDRNMETNKQLFGIDSDADPNVVHNYYKLMLEHGQANNLNKARSIATGMPYEEIPMQMDMQEGLPYEDRPAIGEMEQDPYEYATDISRRPEMRVRGKTYDYGSMRDLEQRRAKLMDMYGEERDPIVKKEISNQIKYLQDQILNERKEKREETKLRHQLEAEPRKFIKSINEQYAGSKKNKYIYEAMNRESKKLSESAKYKKMVTQFFHLPIGVLHSPSEEVIEKMSNQLLQGVSSAFPGGRILQSEIETFLRSIPSLSNSPKAMQTLSKMALISDDLVEKKWKLKNEILKAYKDAGEMIPEDFEDVFYEFAAPLEEEYSQKLIDTMTPGRLSTKKRSTESLEVGSKFDELPDARSVPAGAVMRSDDGSVYKSNGTEWIKS